jgi:hypothetical protein
MTQTIRTRSALAISFLLCSALAVAAPPTYKVDYLVGFVPDAGEATVSIAITPGKGMAERLRFSIDTQRHRGFTGDGSIEAEGSQLTWKPPAAGGKLEYRYKVDRKRGSGGYDARMTDRSALLRIDRLIPPVAVLAPKRAVSISTLRFSLPDGWNQAEVAYVFDGDNAVFPIDGPGRRFHRPLGWMIAGDLGIRREEIDEMHLAVAAARGESMRRNDILAFVNATAAEAREAFGPLPSKLLIVGGGDPLWRGGLSGPNSMYMHADRPMIGENGASTLLHELVHVLTRISGASNDDWIAEGIATFYSIELLRRTGLVTESRAERSFEWMENRGRPVRRLHARNSTGLRTARAVTLFKALDEEIRAATDQEKDLDDVVRALMGKGRVSTAMLRTAAEAAIGEPSRTLRTSLLDP